MRNCDLIVKQNTVVASCWARVQRSGFLGSYEFMKIRLDWTGLGWLAQLNCAVPISVVVISHHVVYERNWRCKTCWEALSTSIV
jgi:hypothetical protein